MRCAQRAERIIKETFYTPHNSASGLTGDKRRLRKQHTFARSHSRARKKNEKRKNSSKQSGGTRNRR